ncbi:MAG TPA: acetoin utilization protein AcuC [Candidatus Lokiarchaeia archaeon]|nr:acetoin utilization protein AcuC [Candidatus Lokiarchaeia archaeon]
MARTALIMSDAFKEYNFGKSHPLKPERVLLTWELIKGLHLDEDPNCTVLEPRLATDEELELYHTKDYVDFVKQVSAALENDNILPMDLEIAGLKYNLGPGDNPVFPKMHEGSSIVVGGTIVAIDAVYDGIVENAFQAGGGLHHAMPSKASGFCIYNDSAVAIKYLLQKHRQEDLKILYIDVDAHHGDGVQYAFYNDGNNVLTLSLHESGKYLFPGTGFIEERGTGEHEGYAVNIPLLPYTYDDLYLEIFDDIVPTVAKAFQPDMIVSQNGVDTHCTDPLAQLGLTTKGHRDIFKKIHEIASQYCHGKLVAVGGGGYNTSVVPRSWTMLFADLLGVDLPKTIPEDILEKLNEGRTSDLIPEYFVDPGPSDEIKMRINDFKFLDEFQLYGLQVRYQIKKEIIPLIEKYEASRVSKPVQKPAKKARTAKRATKK